MLEVQHLSFAYGKKKPLLFDDLSMTLQAGTVCGLLGKNGTGKSTLLYLMAGLLRPLKGQVNYQGLHVTGRHPLSLQDMFLIPEEFILPDVSLRQYIRSHAPFYPTFSEDTLKRCLGDFDMDMSIHLGDLSMGQKKKVFLCFALATQVRLLLMDEPTNGLDILSKRQFRKVIASGMTEERSLLISTHQVHDIDTLLDHVWVLDDTRLLLDESVSHIIDRLCFVEQDLNASTEGALYVQPSLHGNNVIYPNIGQKESALNLELLFNALLFDSRQIQAQFHL